MMVEEFSSQLGPLTVCDKDEELMGKMAALKLTMMQEDWLYLRGKRIKGRAVKVRSGLEVVQRMHKATGGLIRVDYVVKDGRFNEVVISGDYFCIPKDTVSRLATAIEGTPIEI